MRITLEDIIKKFDEGSDKEILNQSFSNDHIVKKPLICVNIIKTEFTNCKFNNVDFNGSYLKNCTFNNCTFEQVTFHKCEFWDCDFENCEVKNCTFTKTDFYTNSFTHCHLQEIDSSWSYFGDCNLFTTKMSKIDFTGAILDNLSFKKSIFSLLKVSKNFPVKFYRTGKLIEVNDAQQLENLLNLA